MERCYLKGETGDRLNAVLSAAGYNIRWLLRMIVKKGLGLFLRPVQAGVMGALAGLVCVVWFVVLWGAFWARNVASRTLESRSVL